jgi:hypothetical protein
LTELLVVIAIISILAGMLLPALNTALDEAQKISCLSQERQIGASLGFYFNDYEERLPFISNGNSATHQITSIFWGGGGKWVGLGILYGGDYFTNLALLEGTGKNISVKPHQTPSWTWWTWIEHEVRR